MPKKKQDGVPPTGGTEENEDADRAKTLLENWSDLDDLERPIQEYLADGWQPRVKTKPNGKRYMSIRKKEKDEETGKWLEQELGIGAYDPEKWELLLSMCPAKTGFPKPYMPRKEPSILKTKLSSPKPIPPTIPLDSDLIEYYLYFQAKGYKGDMGDWMKECARNYLIGNGLEVVVVKRVGEING